MVRTYGRNLIYMIVRRFWQLLLVFAVSGSLVGCAGHAPQKVQGHAAVPKRVVILMYHHIADLPATASARQRRWTLSPKSFSEQMEWLAKQRFHPVSMAQVTAYLKHGVPLPPKPIVLSFDDGWKDHYTVALPILKKKNLVGTFFIITNSVGHSAYLNWEELLELSAAGMDIQSHTREHSDLTKLSDQAVLDEIAGSKKDLEDRLNTEVNVLAYPYGRYNRRVVDLTKRAGFENAVTVYGVNGGYVYLLDQTYVMPRIDVGHNMTIESFSRMIDRFSAL